MNAPFLPLDTRPMALSDRALSHPLVVRFYGARRWSFPGETLVSDLGARIVAQALADCFDHIWRLATEAIPYEQQPLYQGWLNQISNAHAELAGLAHGEDEDTQAAEREAWDAFEDGFGSYRRRA